MEFDIQFTDLTILEANGEYDAVVNIMKKPHGKGVVKDIYVEKWMIESRIVIQNMYGAADFVCHFYHDGKIYISSYSPTIADIHNLDIRCLSYWAQQYGWQRPEPLPRIISDWTAFWKHQWETYIIDCEFFDQRYGEREMNIVFDEEDEEDYE